MHNPFRSPMPAASLAAALTLALAAAAPADQHGQNGESQADPRDPQHHEIHDQNRPKPEKVDPGGPVLTQPPGDAVVLFGGEDLSKWTGPEGKKPGWAVEDGVIRIEPGSGDITTRQSFGDVQMHLEFQTMPEGESGGEGQHRSNSGIFFHGRYEVQILDSHDNPTYADGQAAAIYGQYPPLVNASLPPGEWQSYDVIFRRPRFNDSGELTQPATVTVLHNGVLVQDHEKMTGPTGHHSRPPYQPHGRGTIRLQDHNDDPIKFRNIWVRDLEASGADDEADAARE